MTSKAIPISSTRHGDGQVGTQAAATPVDRQLAASVAHEINNPLGVLLNLLYLLEPEAILTTQGRKYLKLAREEVQRVSAIAHAALHNSRDERVTTSVPKLLENVLELYKSRFDSQRIVIRTRFCVDGDLAVYAGLLRQVLSNLLLNASDAMAHGGQLHARVSAAHEWTGLKRRGLRVTIADTGCGIASDNLARMFDPFFTTKGNNGTGLGLPFVQEVVQKHFGVLRVRSSTTHGHSGSIFTIFLPETETPNSPGDGRSASRESARLSGQTPSRRPAFTQHSTTIVASPTK